MSEENMSMDDFSQAVDASFNTFKDEDQMAWEKVKQYREEKTVLTVTVDGIVNKGVVSYVEDVYKRQAVGSSRIRISAPRNSTLTISSVCFWETLIS